MLQDSPMYSYIPATDMARARAFYERVGFRVTGRSAKDGEGRPYPLLHLVR